MSLVKAPGRRIVGRRATRLSGRRRACCEASPWECFEGHDGWASRAHGVLVTVSETDKLAVQNSESTILQSHRSSLQSSPVKQSMAEIIIRR
jgi:hypothetical protein